MPARALPPKTIVPTRPAYQVKETNRLAPEVRPAHDWYRFVLSYPPHLVRDVLDRFALGQGDLVLDPFCGTGTTVVECKKLGIPSIGIEAHPMAHFAGQTKSNWSVSPRRLREVARTIAEDALETLEGEGVIDDPQPLLVQEKSAEIPLRSLPEEEARLLLTNSISPRPLHKVLTLLVEIKRHATPGTARHPSCAWPSPANWLPPSATFISARK